MDFLASHGFDFNKFVYEVSTRAIALCEHVPISGLKLSILRPFWALTSGTKQHAFLERMRVA